jgi:D-3-phosphoglycerate dehydrogenase
VFAACGVEPVGMEQLLRRSDVVSVHVPLRDSTRGLVGARELALMKPSAILVNTSRGAVVDERALVAALRAGAIAGAALDVFDPEPPTRDNPLFGLPNTLVTPHIGGVTEEGLAALAQSIASELVKALHGERPAHLVAPDIWPPARLARTLAQNSDNDSLLSPEGGRPWPVQPSS